MTNIYVSKLTDNVYEIKGDYVIETDDKTNFIDFITRKVKNIYRYKEISERKKMEEKNRKLMIEVIDMQEKRELKD